VTNFTTDGGGKLFAPMGGEGGGVGLNALYFFQNTRTYVLLHQSSAPATLAAQNSTFVVADSRVSQNDFCSMRYVTPVPSVGPAASCLLLMKAGVLG